MSFSSTPLGQGRRLDHNTFHNKPPSNGNRPPSPRLIPTSYSYGAPTAATRSPPKPTSPSREKTISFPEEDDQNDSALARYARLKQREQATLASRPGGPKIITSPPKPEKWSVKDTSVQIATAFTQAVDMQSASTHNNSWASGSSRPNPSVPRSTSVEYEREAQATMSRRLPAPPSRHAPPRATTGRRPLTKSSSARHVSDSEGEGERPAANGRGKSPFEEIVDSAKRALGPATFYLQQRFLDPSASVSEPSFTPNSKDSSYDYTAEEREFQASQQSKRGNNTAHKRNRMSVDNKAYKPPVSDLESSEYDSEDGDKTKKRRKKKKKEAVGGPLTGLPVISQDKRRRKKSRGSKQNIEGEGEDEESDSEENTDRQSAQRASIPRNSAPPSRLSIPRGSAPPDPGNHNDFDTSMDVEQGLDSIPEVNEEDLHITPDTSYESHYEQKQQRRSTSRPPPSSHIGGPVGSVVYYLVRVFKATIFFFIQLLVTTLYGLGRVLGTRISAGYPLHRPQPDRASDGARILVALFKYAITAAIMSGTWYVLQDPMTRYIPRLSSHPTYHPPSAPAANFAEVASRLQRIEITLATLSLEAEKVKVQSDNEAKLHSEHVGRIGALESLISAESRRLAETEAQSRNMVKDGLNVIRKEVEVLKVQAQQHRQHQGKNEGGAIDEEARVKLRVLEEHIGTIEGGVKESLELSKKAMSGVGNAAGAAWWNKLASGSASKPDVTIKSTDGQDVTALIWHLVQSAVSTYSKDMIARPDFALHSGGARIIPSLTSPTFEIQPPSLRSQLVGLVTGNGYAIGRPPINALHHELINGHCWPFAGSEGQLGIALAAPTYISDVTIDHVAREVVLSRDAIRSAPKEMEVWGMVEGKDNVAKVQEWMTEKTRRREEAKEAAGEGIEVDAEEEYPKTLPRSPQYIRIANFSYDIHGPKHVQTFPVSQEIKDLGIDFGIVVLMIKNNWGREEYTCLYRMRVHGRMMGDTLPSSDEVA